MWCQCCGRTNTMTSGGCSLCNTHRTYCHCGAILRCACGLVAEHEKCPNVFTSSIVVRTSSVTLPFSCVPYFGKWR